MALSKCSFRTTPYGNRNMSTGRRIMAEPIDVIQQALNALADAGLGNDTPAEAFVIGYQAGWQEALDLCIRIETAINNETGANEHHRQ